MRAVLMTLAMSCCAPAWCSEDIIDVLQRSQQMQLDALTAQQVDPASPESQVLQQSFDRVLLALDLRQPGVRLLVVRSPLLAVCLMGRVIAVNVSVADLTGSERMFILAHELGHIAHRHWAQLGTLYKHYIPGEVVPATTDPVAGILGREASELSHRHEYEADAFALRLLRRLGESEETPIVLFTQHLPLVKATATHPGSHQRIAHLKRVE
jgi:Zn-dependent protease with chaperone function